MYTSFFGLNEKPFSISPDPRYLFMSERHTEALAHLMYGVRESGGFIQLTGEVGTGKTTLVRSLLQQLPDTADVALILNPQLSKNEFLSTICEELGVHLPDKANSIKALINALNAYLLENHSRAHRTILIVDEAQNLRLDVLEQVRLLTNLETTKQKLLQIILIGQPELREILSRNDMRQLAQRVTGRYHLEPLSQHETQVYIDHRLKVAGAVGPIFTVAGKKELYRLSHGVPRRINVIADRALLGAFTQDVRQVTPNLLRKAAAEVLDRSAASFSPWRRWARGGAIVAGLAVIALGAGWAWSEWSGPAVRGNMSTAAPATGNAVIAPGTSTEPALPAAAGAESDDSIDNTSSGENPAMISADGSLPATESVPETGIAGILDENSTTTTTVDAFETLFRFWGAEYSRGAVGGCQQAETYGLYCLMQSGSLAQVRRLNRPVIFTLRDYQGQEHQVVLSGLDEDIAVVSIAGNNYSVSADELADYWFGDYLLLWQPASSEVTQFIPGMRDQGIIWLRESLAEIQGEPIMPMSSMLFDSELEARVRNYQREQRLDVDGVVGYQTQIAINTDLGSIDRPRLVRAN
jgi:general secretion pathway protein A